MLVICALENQPDLVLCVVDGPLDSPADNTPAAELRWQHWESKRKVALDVPRRERVKTRFSGHTLGELSKAYTETEAMPLHEARERARQLDTEFSARLVDLTFMETDGLRRRAVEAWKGIRAREGVEAQAEKARKEWADRMARKAAQR